MTTNKQLTLPGTIVKKSNEIVRARMRLENTFAARIFTSLIACIKESDKDFQEYKIPTSAVIHAEDKGGKSYKLVRQALKTITGYSVELPLPIEDEYDEKEPPYAIIPLFAYAHYKKGIITAQIHPKLKPHFMELASHFTSYKLIDYLLLSGTYSQRLFEILNSYVKTNTSITILLEDLHRMLNTPETLQRYSDFRRFALEKAHKEINEKTRLEYEWVPVKKGRNVVAIEFIFSKKRKKIAEEKKREVIQEKTSKINNTNFLKAMECVRNKNKNCTKKDNKQTICELCAKYNFANKS